MCFIQLLYLACKKEEEVTPENTKYPNIISDLQLNYLFLSNPYKTKMIENENSINYSQKLITNNSFNNYEYQISNEKSTKTTDYLHKLTKERYTDFSEAEAQKLFSNKITEKNINRFFNNFKSIYTSNIFINLIQ